MLPSAWQSKTLYYDRFNPHEASLAKSIYDSTAALMSSDPHFGQYPIEEFSSHIDSDQTGQTRDGSPLFFLRCIRDRKTNAALGYFQFELDAPESGRCWLPMFVLNEQARGRGVSHEAVESLIHTVSESEAFQSVGLNVYVENARALKFWFMLGWQEILGVDIESHQGNQFTCLTLSRKL